MATYYVSTAGNDTTGDGSSGNPWKSITKGLATMAGGDILYVKADGTYSDTATSETFPLVPKVGTAAAYTRVYGYTSTPGDNGQATVKIQTTGTTIFQFTNAYALLANFVLDCNSKTSSNGLKTLASNGIAHNVSFTAYKNVAIDCSGGYLSVLNCYFYSNAASAYAAIYGYGNFVGNVVIGGNSLQNGIYHYGSANAATVSRNVVYNVSGPGIVIGGTQSAVFWNTVHSCATGLLAGTNSQISLLVTNNIFYNNSTYGINFTSSAGSDASPLIDYNALGSNGTARNNCPTGAHDISLSGDPCTNAASGNFALNTTSGRGAACRAAGWPGAFPGGSTTGYLDVGAVQHPDPSAVLPPPQVMRAGPTWFPVG